MLITAQGRSHGELFVSQVEEKSCKGCSFQGLSRLDVHIIEKGFFLFMEKNEETHSNYNYFVNTEEAKQL